MHLRPGARGDCGSGKPLVAPAITRGRAELFAPRRCERDRYRARYSVWWTARSPNSGSVLRRGDDRRSARRRRVITARPWAEASRSGRPGGRLTTRVTTSSGVPQLRRGECGSRGDPASPSSPRWCAAPRRPVGSALSAAIAPCSAVRRRHSGSPARSLTSRCCSPNSTNREGTSRCSADGIARGDRDRRRRRSRQVEAERRRRGHGG